MATAVTIRVLPLVTAVLTLIGSARAADAGWVTIQNTTNRVVVVQGTVESRGQEKRGKPVRLLPGESIREHHTAPALKVEVFDGQNPNKSLYSGSLTIRGDRQTFSIGTDGRSVQVTPVPDR